MRSLAVTAVCVSIHITTATSVIYNSYYHDLEDLRDFSLFRKYILGVYLYYKLPHPAA
ncbi:hypothetical protein M422DRAFT_270480 [Sphaerobolus stellatus SS14]|uniref:Uncharacterized protein n=1 Tax=Sphaerobolus stellatus (strain SS14) TaxID=990650 RepID=A0A0C9UGZ2_SPHS4|nr:hypothetical protein M422DRAFT_270480 [Sphaerobolus stellatus SS14]